MKENEKINCLKYSLYIQYIRILALTLGGVYWNKCQGFGCSTQIAYDRKYISKVICNIRQNEKEMTLKLLKLLYC